MIATLTLSIVIITAAILIHYEMLFRMTTIMPKLPIRHRFRLIFGIFGALIAHVIEIWIFACGYYLMLHMGEFGTLNGNFDNSLIDCNYFSFTTYTSLGFGDIEPLGNIRFLVGLEALTGLVMITWTASFLFIEMQKFWNKK